MRKTLIIGAVAVFVAMANVPQVVATECQPKMRVALELLKTAQENLQEADADKGGHKTKAIKLLDEAIEEVRAGIRYDNRN